MMIFKSAIISALCLASVSFGATENPQPPPPYAPPGSAGLPVDRQGGPTIDPTANVLALVQAAVKRIDDLREADEKLAVEKSSHQKDLLNAEKELTTERVRHQQELSEQFSKTQEQLRIADTGLNSAIRIVDREDVAKTAASAQTAIATLAKQTTDLATAVQKTLADTAVAVEQRQTAFASEVNGRLGKLEIAASERQGKQQVSDPQIDQLRASVENLKSSVENGAGKSTGMSNLWALIAGGIILLVVLYSAFTSRQNGKMIRNGRA